MHNLPYFAPASLLSRFRSAVAQAEVDTGNDPSTLSLAEATWLSRLDTHASVPGDMRVQAQTNAQPVSTHCLVIQHANAQWSAAYLFSPLHGVQAFATLGLLHDALQKQSHGLLAAAPRFAHIEGDVFSAWSRQVVKQRMTRLNQLDSALGQLPRFQATLNECLAAPFAKLLQGVAKPAAHPLRIVRSSDAVVVRTLSLAEAALDSLAGTGPAKGHTRQFFTAYKQTASSFDYLCEKALATAVSALPAAFAAAIDTACAGHVDDYNGSLLNCLAAALCDGFVCSLLQALNEGSLDDDEFQWLRGAVLNTGSTVQPALLTFVHGEHGARQRVTMAGALILYSADSNRPPYFRYCATLGLQRFDSLNTLMASCLGELKSALAPRYLTTQDWQALAHAEHVQLELTVLDTNAFEALATSLIALLKQRLVQALTPCGGDAGSMLAAVEDALNISALVDAELLKLQHIDATRADAGPPQNEPCTPGTSNPGGETQLADVFAGLQWLQRGQPTLSDCVNQMFALPMAVLTQGRLTPRDIHLGVGSNIETLADYTLEQLRQPDNPEQAPPFKLLDKQLTMLAWPTANDVRQLVVSLKDGLQPYYQAALDAYDRGRSRHGATLLDVEQQRYALLDASLRLDLAQQRRKKNLPAGLLDTFEDALNYSTTLRVRALTLKLLPPALTQRLPLCYLLDNPSHNVARLVLWTPLNELCTFDSEHALSEALNRCFSHEQSRDDWLSLFEPQWRSQIKRQFLAIGANTPVLIGLETVPSLVGDMAQEVRRMRSAQYRLNFGQAVELGFDAPLFTRYLDQRASTEHLAIFLQRLETTANEERTLQRIPAWLRDATPQAFTALNLILQSCIRVTTPAFNYLFAIPSLSDFARDTLSIAIKADHPDWPQAPDDIEVTLKNFTTAIPPTGELPSAIPAATRTVRQTLTECALNHFTLLNVASITVHTKTARPDEKLPTANELRALIDRLDIGNQYRQLLEDRLSSSSPDYLKRRKRYSDRLVPFLMAETFQYRLQKKLSAQAFHAVAHTLQMPDAIARPLLDGVELEFSQFQLRASAELKPDSALGLYLIGPRTPSKGPLVLFNAYSEQQVAREFLDEAELLSTLRQDHALQKLVLTRMAPEVRSRYDHNGFLHPHVQWSSSDLFDFTPHPDVLQLSRKPVHGNALHYLFEEHVQVLKQLAKSRTISTAEADWSAFRYLMTLGVDQVSMFIPSQLGLLLNAWQGAQLIAGSLQSAEQRSWGESLAELTAGLMLVAAGRQASGRNVRPGQPNGPPSPVIEPAPVKGTHADLEVAPNSTLATFEAWDVELNGMTPLKQSGLFQHPVSLRRYAVLSGKIYEVQPTAERWRIIKGKSLGPLITQATDLLWRVDTQQGLRGGGFVSAYEQAFADATIDEHFITLASGMPAIRSTHLLKYQMLQSAHQQAQDYLTLCLRNLNTHKPWKPLHSEVERILAQTFDTPSTPRIVADLRDYSQRLLSELLSAELAPQTSKRYVVGINMVPSNLTTAFTHLYDPLKRLFLTERFFALPAKVALYGTPSETHMRTHQQAVTLIHELSHIKLRTVDIAYVEATTPYLDQFDLSTDNARAFQEQQREAKEGGLSLRTPDELLFTHYDVTTGTWSDFQQEHDRIKQVILKLSKCSTLLDARAAFRSDPHIRAAIVFANADSLALLISQLGRRRYAVPPQNTH